MTLSKIEWCTRSDWNPIRGCTRVSPGCGGPGKQGGCYAEAMAARFSKSGQWGHGFAEMRDHEPRWIGKVELQEDRVWLPLSWRKPARIFASSTSDVFHEALPDAAIDTLFAVMALCPQHTFQVLTKRAERMLRYLENCEREAHCGPLSNIWLGVSAEDQQRADERREPLKALAATGWTTFVSYEPALGPVDWTGWEFLQWLISGGESGPRARPSHPDWHRASRDWCEAARVPFFFKQWGEWASHRPTAGGDLGGDCRADRVRIVHRVAHSDAELCQRSFYPGDTWAKRVGKRAAGRLLDGIEHNAMPLASRGPRS